MQQQLRQHTKRAEACIQHKQQQKLGQQQKLEVLTTKCKQCLKTLSLKISKIYTRTLVCVCGSVCSCKFYVSRNKVSRQNLPQ